MRGGEAFEEVLDQHIQRLEADRRVTFTATGCSTATAYGFFFSSSPSSSFPPSPLRGFSETGSDLLRGPGQAVRRTVAPSHRRAFAPSHPPLPPRSYGATGTRTLSAHERHALHELIALGAALHEGFTRRELRSAFRALARRYHPDRHTDSSADHKARLATLFSRVCDSYQVLARV
ncbi:MAG TPA: J domain-containing protein [Vicinamibacterales bacterium]|nr:J domain-containing protein [Vicinamibacterales bacterium]